MLTDGRVPENCAQGVERESGDWGLAQAKRGETQTSDSDMDTRKGYV